MGDGTVKSIVNVEKMGPIWKNGIYMQKIAQGVISIN